MRKILRGFIGVPATLLAVAIVAAGALFAYLRWRDSQAASFASSVVAENSPIAEFASRRIVWKVVRCDSSVSSDTMRETVYTIKAGYDLTKADPPVVDAVTAAASDSSSCTPPKRGFRRPWPTTPAPRSNPASRPRRKSYASLESNAI